ncbi:hypothetical protein DUI87_26004 [Hirundo rustica rustica]|uniref:Uncharacterized protein n=1 Tax=Hirundo rustica rustica TaxID=333673 RepID=A0A3M0JEW1_HIRRU|nr:hypothetical protein DUI87_26004 [Hirundo rustica rustica]
MDAMAQLPLPAGLGAGTFPAKLWSLVNDPRVRSLRWDSEARGLLVDRSLFERELLRPGGAQGPAPNAFRATQFRSFVRQLYRYGFRKPLPRERPPLARRPPCGFHLLHRERPGPARREGPSRFQELYGERPLPAERELLRVPPCHFQGFHGEQLLPPRWEGPRSRMQELYGEQPPPLDRELLWMQPCSFQQLHREQQPPASNPSAAAGTSAPHAPAGSAGCAASTASSSAQNAPAQEESPALDLGQEIEKMIREIRNSLPVKAPSAQGNINVAPESPGEDPMNRAEAEEVSSGTESCRNSSPEPEEPGLHRVQVVSSCDLSNGESMDPTGVNPRGLKALELWQTDVTQVTEFGRLKYVHVTVDTFSSVMWASAHTGEKARDVIAHWRQAFAVLGIPSAVKTDSGPAYASQQALDSEQQPRAKVRVRNLVTKQWEGPYDLIAMGRGYACVSTDTGTCWLPSKCVRPDLRPQRQNSADRQGGSRDQLESHQVDESSSDHSDDSSTDSD